MRSQDHTDLRFFLFFLLFPPCTASCHLSCGGLVQNTLEGLFFFFLLLPIKETFLPWLVLPIPQALVQLSKRRFLSTNFSDFLKFPATLESFCPHLLLLSSLLRDLHLSPHAPLLLLHSDF